MNKYMLTVAAAASFTLAAVAQTQPTPAAAGATVVTTTATVEAVDPATRMVTLKAANGETVTFKAGPEVKNLAQVKKGDIVTSKHIRALALELKKGGDGIRSSTEQVAKAGAKPGEKPAGAVADQLVVVADVTKVDTANKLVTLRGPKGNSMDLEVRDPAKLSQIKVGDQVQATYTEAVIVEVSTPKK